MQKTLPTTITGLLVLILMLTLVSAEAQTLYRWVDENGRVHYSDEPPEGASEAEEQAVPRIPSSGVRLADEAPPEEEDKTRSTGIRKRKIDSYCRRYRSELNRTELYLKHTPNERDEQRAKDLKQQIRLECNGLYAKHSYRDSRCRRYHSNLNKLRVFQEHSPNGRDARRIKDLQQQIRLECE